MEKRGFVGVDVSKMTLDVAIYSEDKMAKETHLKIKNDECGYKTMMNWLTSKKFSRGSIILCMEYTGSYTIKFRLFLEKSGIDYCMVSPLHLKRSMGLVRGKTDKIDAHRIADFCYTYRHKLMVSRLPVSSLYELKELMSERDRHIKYKRMLELIKTEHTKFLSERVLARNQKMLDEIINIINQIDMDMMGIIEEDESLNKNYTLLISIVGIGRVNAINTIIHTNNFEAFRTARQYACYVGVAPFPQTSGSSIKGKMKVSKLCNVHLKAQLTQGAKSASRWDPELSKYMQRKIAEGKNYGIVINAIKFKLIERMFAVVKRGTPFVKIAAYAAASRS